MVGGALLHALRGIDETGKHDLDTDEMCSEKVNDKSKITPRLHAESVYYSDTGGHKSSDVTIFGSWIAMRQPDRHGSQIAIHHHKNELTANSCPM